jgi:glucose/mannose-6-phosphate isomerase
MAMAPAPEGFREMLALVYGLPGQLGAGIATARSATLGKPGRFDNVVIAGMGGSGIGGKIARDLLAGECPLPILSCQDYGIPAAVTGRTLFIAVSHSGNTEETLSAYCQAHRRRCRIVAITSGGELASLAGKNGHPVVNVPGGMLPRTALGYLLSPLLVVLGRLGVCLSYESELKRAATLMRNRTGKWHAQAGTIARALNLGLPVVYSTSRLLDAVADRWRGQLNENAKVLCHTNVLPELDHNEIVGIGGPGATCGRAVIIALTDRETHPRNRLRLEHTLSITRGGYLRAVTVESEGKGKLERILSLVMLGDLVSVELARLRGVNPMAIERIDRLKVRMAGAKGG